MAIGRHEGSILLVGQRQCSPTCSALNQHGARLPAVLDAMGEPQLALGDAL